MLPAVGLGVAGGVFPGAVHPLAPRAAPKPSRTSTTALTARLPLALPLVAERMAFSPERMGAKLATSGNPRRSYPHLEAPGRVLASIGT